MKRLVFLFLILATLLSGCSSQTVAEATEPVPVRVSDADGFLEALSPGARIILEPGNYIFSEAAGYGIEPESGYYTWQSQGDDYQLVLTGLQDLTIQGSGRESTFLRTNSLHTNVLVLENCTDVFLENFTLGFDVPDDRGGGLDLVNCTNTSLNNLRLTGCGTVGLYLENCQVVSLTGCEISQCRFLGIRAEQTNGLTVENTVFRELGNAQYGDGGVFKLGQCANVRVTSCDILDNKVTSLIDCYPCDNVIFTGNTFTGNQVQNAVFDVDGGLVFDGNIFDNNLIVCWFTSERATVLDSIGKSWNAEMLDWYYHPPQESLPEGERNQIHVTTTDELLSAIASNTEIILDSEFYDLSTASDYGTGYTDHYYWSEEFDGPSLVITDVTNLTIRSADGNRKGCTLSAVPRYANVLSFSRCNGITVSGLTAGHTVEPGYCMGGVLYFRNSDNILVENCGLYGCGILGVQADLSGNLAVKNCDIYECSYGGLQLAEVAGVTIEGCTFRDLGGDSMQFYDCKDVTVDGKTVSGNSRIS